MINGVEHSMEDVRVLLGDVRLVTLRNISYSTMRERENVYTSSSALPTRRARGPKMFEGSCTILHSELVLLQSRIPTPLSLIDLPPLVVVVNYRPLFGTLPTTDILLFVEINGLAKAMSQDQKFMEIELPLAIGDIRYNI